MSESSPSSSHSTASQKRRSKPQKRLSKPQNDFNNVPQGHASFRLLCHKSLVGKIIGPGGSVITKLKQSTGSHRIWAKDGVICIIASATAPTKTTLSNDNDGVASVVVSKAQGALLRVFEKILEVSGAGGGDVVGEVSCRLLVDGVKVMGIEWDAVQKIKRDCGCLIKIWGGGGGDKLPACADPGDHVIKIKGNILAVKKALVAVSYHLQDCPVSGKPKTPCGEVAHQASADVPNNSMGSASGVYHSSTEANRTSMVDKMLQLQEVTFRILCSCELAGDIIGRNDTIVKDLERKSGANIKVGPVFAECEERLITINSLENPGMQLPSPAQRALDLVLTKLIEAGSEKGLYASLSEPTITARLVILSTQASWLLGRKCTRLKAINKATGANIWVYQNDPVLKCACEYDTIVEINGDVSQVQNAVSHVAGRLRENILSNMPNDSEISNETLKTASSSGPSGQDPEVNSSPNPGQHFPEMQNSDHTGASPEGKILGKFSHVTDTLSLVAGRLPFWNILNNARTSYGRQRFNDAVEQDTAVNNSPHLNQNYADLHDPDDAGTSLKAGSKIGSVTVLNVTKNVKLEVPEHDIGFVCGENDSNLAHLRQISGAQVLVCEPHDNRRHRILAISGNVEDVDLALELLQHYILTDS